MLRRLPAAGADNLQPLFVDLSKRTTTVLGRDKDQVDVVVESKIDRMLSRKHVAISKSRSKDNTVVFLLADQNSTNGVLVNRVCRKTPVELQQGDQIALGGAAKLKDGEALAADQPLVSDVIFCFEMVANLPASLTKNPTPPTDKAEPQSPHRVSLQKLVNGVITQPSTGPDSQQNELMEFLTRPPATTEERRREEEARQREEELRKKEEELRKREEEEAARKVEEENKRRQDEEIRRQEAEEARRQEEEARRQEEEVRRKEWLEKMAQLEQEALKRKQDAELVAAAESNKRKLLVADLSSEWTCAICEELLVLPHTTSCTHSFCKSCIADWIKTKGAAATCPTCRQPISTAPIHARLMDISIDKIASETLSESELKTRELRIAAARALPPLTIGAVPALQVPFPPPQQPQLPPPQPRPQPQPQPQPQLQFAQPQQIHLRPAVPFDIRPARPGVMPTTPPVAVRPVKKQRPNRVAVAPAVAAVRHVAPAAPAAATPNVTAIGRPGAANLEFLRRFVEGQQQPVQATTPLMAHPPTGTAAAPFLLEED